MVKIGSIIVILLMVAWLYLIIMPYFHLIGNVILRTKKNMNTKVSEESIDE